MPQTNARLAPPTKERNASPGLQALLLLDIWIRLVIWSVALGVTLFVLSRTETARSLSWNGLMTLGGAWSFSITVTHFILLFNVAYVLTLVVLRLPFPRPQSGVYRMDRSIDRSILLAAFLAVLTKARFHAPFPAIFVSHLASIMPFRWMLGKTLGPSTKSSFFLDPNIIDPWGVDVGKNVTIGFGATVTCHLQERDYIIIDRVVIEDDVNIGAYAGISCGVHIKKGAVLEPYAAVKPRTIIGENELWGGRPAFKKGMVRPTGTSQRTTTEQEAQEEAKSQA